MSGSKKLVINLSETLYNEFQKVLKGDSKKRSKLISDVIISYSIDKKRIKHIEQMRNGYIEMSQLNIEISELGFELEMVELKEYEAKLSESDIADDSDGEKRRYILC